MTTDKVRDKVDSDSNRARAAPHPVTRMLLVAAAVSALALVAIQVIVGWREFDGRDFTLYRDVTERWVSGGAFYQPWQLEGPYEVWARYGAILYPPISLLLFMPFLVLPAWFWWAVPLGVIAFVLWRLRPRVESWPLIALCLAWPPSIVMIAHGNPAMWIAAVVALTCLVRWTSALVVLKPTLVFVPFFVSGSSRSSWWVAILVLGFVALPFGVLWVQWLRVIDNATDMDLLRGVQEVPLVAISLVAMVGRTSQGAAIRG